MESGAWKSKAKTTAEFNGRATWLLSTDPLYLVLQINKAAHEKHLFHGQEEYGFHPGISGSSEHSQKLYQQTCFPDLVQWFSPTSEAPGRLGLNSLLGHSPSF